jgi:antitoxin CptB
MPHMTDVMTDPARKRLLFQAMHRGFKEADILLGSFAERYLPEMTDAQVEEFSQLLEAPDHDLYAWIIGRADTPANLDGEVMQMLKSFSPVE